MIIWGGDSGDAFLNTGGRYDPTEDIWRPMSLVGAPSARFAHSFIWTGDRLFLLENGTESGYFYDPRSNAWTSLPSPNQNQGCERPAATQAGAVVAVCTFGMGRDALLLLPGETSWRTFPLPTGVAPQPGLLWTGKRLFVWGGTVPSTFSCPVGQMIGCDPPSPTYSNAGWVLEP